MHNHTVLQLIRSDLERLAQPGLLNFLKWYFVPRGSTFRYQVWFRLLQGCKKHSILKFTIGIPVYWISRHYENLYGIHVNANINVGPGLCIVHGNGVFLNCKEIGSNFTVYQNVTLGSSHGGIPTVKDNVTVYVGAVAVGDIVLEDGCTVGANAFLNKSVTAGATVVGVPARDISGSHLAR